MSAPENKPPKRMTILPVLADDFVRFLKSKAQSDDDVCPVCGKDHWTILCPAGDQETFRLGTPVRNKEEIFYVSTFAYYCQSCGYLRQHFSDVVYRWVQENPLVDNFEADTEEGGGREEGEPINE